MHTVSFLAQVPVTLECPEAMGAAVRYVLEGEYESHHDGAHLDILDIGANVGAFAIWAALRWPGSRIFSYEPNPGTFAMLKRNTAAFANVSCFNSALFPGARLREPFFARFDGDGEGGLVTYASDTFEARVVKPSFEVSVVDPATLPSADVVKIDIEGGEAAVLAALDLSRTSLVLIEFQNRRNRLAMRQLLSGAFEPVLDEECPWDPILDYQDYRRELKGDIYGRMFYARQGQTRLQRHMSRQPSEPA